MKTLILVYSFGLVSLGLLTIGCAGNDSRLADSSAAYIGGDGQTTGQQVAGTPPGAHAYWDGDQVNGRPSMVLDLSQQTVRFYKGGQLVATSPVSTGKEGYDTPTGNFRIIQKDKDHVSSLYGDFVDGSGKVVVANVSSKDSAPAGAKFQGSPMPYFMRIQGGIGLHGGFLPGVPDSHGCIRMPTKMAQVFFENAPEGTPIAIVK